MSLLSSGCRPTSTIGYCSPGPGWHPASKTWYLENMILGEKRFRPNTSLFIFFRGFNSYDIQVMFALVGLCRMNVLTI